EALPQEAQRERQRKQAQEYAPVAGAERLQRALEPRLLVATAARELAFEEEPEEQPGERERDRGKREEQRERGGEQREKDACCLRGGRGDRGAGGGTRRDQRQAEPHRRQHRCETDRAEGGAARAGARHAHVPPVVEAQVEQLE